MKRRYLLVLVLAVVTVGAVFAQDNFESMPKNTITVDVGPTFIGAFLGGLADSIGEEGASSSGFGIGVQYERPILEKVTLGGRFAYLGFGMGVSEEDGGIKAVLKMSLSSFSLEGHARFYPAGRIFFLDGMLGYAGLSANFTGEVIEIDSNGRKSKESVSFSAYRSYIKYGSKIGWRIDFGSPGGFIFEPSFGYYGGLGLGDTLGKKLAKGTDGDVDVSNMDEAFSLFEDILFVGGPRLSLSFGWRF